MPLAIVPPQFFLPFDSIKLGRFITNVDYPHQGYHDPPAAEPPNHFVASRSSYIGVRENATGASFASALAALMSAGFSKRAKSKVRIATEHIKTYTLDNSDSWFEKAVCLPLTRSWIERAVDRGDTIYLIVGFHSVLNARIIQESIQGTQASAQISLPAKLSLTTSSAVAPLGNLIDPCVGGNNQNIDNSQSQFMAPGEQICALQYRKVRHRWLSSRAIDTMRLSKSPQWLSVERGRFGEEDDEEDDEDVIEVQLKEFDQPDGEWDTEEVSGGEILLIRS